MLDDIQARGGPIVENDLVGAHAKNAPVEAFQRRDDLRPALHNHSQRAATLLDTGRDRLACLLFRDLRYPGVCLQHFRRSASFQRPSGRRLGRRNRRGRNDRDASAVATLTGAHADRVTRVRDLLSAKGRKEHGRFTFEGPTLLEEALRSGVVIEELYVSDTVLASNATVRRLDESGTPVYVVDDRTSRKISGLDTPTGLVAVSAQRQADLDVLLRGPLTLVLADLNDPGNVGTCFAGRGFRRNRRGPGTARRRFLPSEGCPRGDGVDFSVADRARVAGGAGPGRCPRRYHDRRPRDGWNEPRVGRARLGYRAGGRTRASRPRDLGGSGNALGWDSDARSRRIAQRIGRRVDRALRHRATLSREPRRAQKSRLPALKAAWYNLGIPMVLRPIPRLEGDVSKQWQPAISSGNSSPKRVRSVPILSTVGSSRCRVPADQEVSNEFPKRPVI